MNVVAQLNASGFRIMCSAIFEDRLSQEFDGLVLSPSEFNSLWRLDRRLMFTGIIVMLSRLPLDSLRYAWNLYQLGAPIVFIGTENPLLEEEGRTMDHAFGGRIVSARMFLSVEIFMVRKEEWGGTHV